MKTGNRLAPILRSSLIHCVGAMGLLGLMCVAGPVQAQAPIRLGRVVVMSGPLAPYGLAKNAGADLVYSKVNRSGGVNRRRIEVITEDDKYDPPSTVRLTTRMAEDKSIVGLVGYVGVPTVGAVLGLAQQHNIPLIGPTSGTDELRTPFKRFVFPIRASYVEEAKRGVSHLAGIGIKRIAVVYQSNAFGEIGRDAYLAALRGAGITPVDVIALTTAGADAGETLGALVKTEAQAVLFSGFTKPAASLIQAVRKSSNAGAAIYCLSAVDTTELLGMLGAAARGVVVSQVVPVPTTPTLPIVRDYLKATVEAKQSPSFYGLQGYVEARIVVEALRRINGSVSRLSLVSALESLQDFDVGGMIVRYGPSNRDGMKFVDLTVVSTEGQLRR